MKIDSKIYEEKMKKALDFYEESLSSVRAGRANTGVLSKVMVEYYGVPTAINSMAEVKITDARTIAIMPWDSSTLKNIEKAILASDIGITPANDGKCIRLVFPQLTEERRIELKKQIAKMGEEAKVAIRNIRRDANDQIKADKKNSTMTEDEAKQSEKIIQDLTDKYIKVADEITAKKDTEIMSI